MILMCDIDGCVADVRDVIKKYLQGKSDWDEYFKHQGECLPIPWIIDLVKLCLAKGYEVIFFTGRPERVQDDTIAFLQSNVTKYNARLLMRPDNYKGPTQNLKIKWFSKYKPYLIIEDDPAVVKIAVAAGFRVLQVHGYRYNSMRDYKPGDFVPLCEMENEQEK